jgi:hypothetical protein
LLAINQDRFKLGDKEESLEHLPKFFSTLELFLWMKFIEQLVSLRVALLL